MKQIIKVKVLTEGCEPTFNENGDWIDLRAAENVKLSTGEFKLINLGISMKLPEGYEAHVVPRSSTFKTWGILQTNSMGIIDNSYSGTRVRSLMRSSILLMEQVYLRHRHPSRRF